MDDKHINDLIAELDEESLLRLSHPNEERSSALMFSALSNILALLRELLRKQKGVQGLSDETER